MTSIQSRFQKLLSTMIPDNDKLQALQTLFQKQFAKSLEHNRTSSNTTEKQEIRIMDTGIKQLPTKKSQGIYYSISIEEMGVRAGCVQISHQKIICDKNNQVYVSYEQVQDPCDKILKKLTDPEFTATIFVATILKCAQEFVKKLNVQATMSNPLVVTMASYLFLDKSRGRNEFLCFDELCPPLGKARNDPLTYVDITYLCNVQFLKNEIPVKVMQSISHSAAALLAASHELPKDKPACLVSIKAGERFHISYYQANAQDLKFSGSILDVDISHITGNKVDSVTSCTVYGLPYTVPDFKLSLTPLLGQQFYRDFEKMTSSKCLPELCRHMLIHVFQSETPPAVWVPESFDISHCFAILKDTSDIQVIQEIIERIWNWKASLEHLQIIKKIVIAVFTRAAALIAIVLSCVAKLTGRLQPALGGVSVVVNDHLIQTISFQGLVRFYLDKIFKRDTSQLLMFCSCDQSYIKGAALYGLSYQYLTE